MSIQHYNGFLGTFDYDDTQFELRDLDSVFGGNGSFYATDLLEDLSGDKLGNSIPKYLHYIGSETDGSKIKIPDGIKSCSGMFAGTDIESVPTIPDSVVSINLMCYNCEHLKQATALHNRFKDAGYAASYAAYSMCHNIDSIVVPRDRDSYFIPYSGSLFDVTLKYEGKTDDKNNMRWHNSSILGSFAYDPDEFIPLVDGVRYIGDETDGSKIKIPDGIFNANHMFSDCNLTSCPVIPKSIDKDCMTTMFKRTGLSTSEICWAFANRNRSLSLPEGNQFYSGELGTFVYNPDEFEISSNGVHYIGSETDGSKIKIPDGITNTGYMFDGNKSLVTPPVIPTSVKRCIFMFRGCSSLKQPPVIHGGIENGVSSMFDGCPRSVRLKGQWNAEHRGRQYDEYTNTHFQQRGVSGFDFE